MTWSVVFRTRERNKFVAVGEEEMRLEVYHINEDRECLIETEWKWPGCERFIGDVFYDQLPTEAWSKAEIMDRYGGLCKDTLEARLKRGEKGLSERLKRGEQV